LALFGHGSSGSVEDDDARTAPEVPCELQPCMPTGDKKYETI